MYSEINEKMEEAQQGIARLQKIYSILNQLQEEQENLNQKCSELKVIFDKESSDVEKIENKNIASMFYSLLGSLDKHIEKEREEALAAELKYDQAVKDMDDIKYQISKLTTERLNYAYCQNEYDRLYAEKRETLMRENGETAHSILQATNGIGTCKSNLKEIDEAISAGNRVLNSLNNALESLCSAENWGTWDMLGGGLLTDIAKHSRIDDAKAEIENTQSLLRQFKSELTDINITAEVTVETEGFAKFADFFFDGLIADWLMQSKINQSQDSVERVKNQVLNVMRKLEQLKKDELANSHRLNSQINELIAKSTI